MITFKDTYEIRKKEINDFIELMVFLENKASNRADGTNEFAKFFYEDDDKINLTYQSLINILKSNVSLMIYNIIEYAVSNLIDSIYDEIKINNLSYEDVDESIRSLWIKTMLKTTNDPNANFNTFLKKNQEIINCILSKSTVEMHSKNTLPGGNLDGESIKATFKMHGIDVNTSSKNFRPDILDRIKENRNNLAHGSISFVDAVRMESISDIENNEKFVISFLDELIDTVEFYLRQQKYKRAQ